MVLSMKRKDILDRLGYSVPEIKKNRVIIHSDISSEADDVFAIVHHILTPCSDVIGIVASHYEWRYNKFEQLRHLRETTLQKSYDEGEKLLSLMGIDDVSLLKGAKTALVENGELPESNGADFIINEAMKESDKPLFIALQSSLTDLAIALKKKPEIASRLTAIWIGGGKYPHGGDEPNMREDLHAARIVFESPVAIWQIPNNVYPTMELSFAELVDKVKPCGDVGAYLCKQMLDLNNYYGNAPVRMDFPHGESWSIGDNPTVAVLMQNKALDCWHIEKAPIINSDYTYSPNPSGKDIRVYDWVDTRLAMNDFFSKLRLCYGT